MLLRRVAASAPAAARAAQASALAPTAAVARNHTAASVSHWPSSDGTEQYDMPLRGLANRIAEPFGPVLTEFAESERRRAAKSPASPSEVWIPSLAKCLPATHRFATSSVVREVLIYDEKKVKKPRLSWYNPYDTTWVPSGWFSEGLLADMNYYYGEVVAKGQK